MRIFLKLSLVFMLLSTVLLPTQATGQLFFFSHPLKGKPAIDFDLQMTDGNTVNFKEFRAGRPAIIFFWATWCPHCRVQLKELNKSIDGMEEKGIALALIDLEESRGSVMQYLNSNNISLKSFLDADADVARDYSINKDGVIKAVEHEFPKNYEAILF